MGEEREGGREGGRGEWVDGASRETFLCRHITGLTKLKLNIHTLLRRTRTSAAWSPGRGPRHALAGHE